MKANGGEREGVVLVKTLNRTPEACLYVRSSASSEPASRTLLFQQVVSKAPEHDLASLDCEQGRPAKRARVDGGENQENTDQLNRLPLQPCHMRKAELQEGTAVACASPGSVLQSDGQAKGELPAAVQQNEDGSGQQTRSCEQPAALSDIVPTAPKVDSESGTGTELRAAARVLQEASAVQAQQQPMPPACAAPLDTAIPRMEVSAAASTLQNLSAAQPEEHEPNAAGPSQPGHIASRAQPAYEEGGATPETIAAVNEMYHLNTPYEVDAEAAAAGAERLRKYRQHVEKLKKEGRAKPDMIAFSQRKVELGTPLETIGHIPGVRVGAKFQNKGELAIMGVHCNITGGIYCKGRDNPAYSIVLSGNYSDDHDAGETIDYTGQGGQDKDGRQIKDQEWTMGNAALKRSFELGTPVRVARGVNLEKTYDGLYRITKCWKEAGKDDHIICRLTMYCVLALNTAPVLSMLKTCSSWEAPKTSAWFRLVPIPGHSLLSERVTNRVRHSRRDFTRVQLQGGQRLPVSSTNLHRLPPPTERQGLICEDISGGLEKVKIPAFNNVDDTRLDPLEYTRESVIGTPAAQERAELAKAAYTHVFCGRAKMGITAYDDQGLVTRKAVNYPCYAECPASCTGRQCTRNKVVTQGIVLPLEVVYTGPARKWGLTCAQDIPEGAFVCEYAGRIITDEEADVLDTAADHDKYLYDMSDFVRGVAPEEADNGFRPPVPADPSNPALAIETCLTIDARSVGNVARFMNHACTGSNNVFPRPVLVEGSTGLWYKVAFFASKFIPVGTELTYDYHWNEDQWKQGCHCGSHGCIKPAAACANHASA